MTAIGNDRADRFWPTSTVQEIQVEAPYSQFPFNKLSEAPRGLAERNTDCVRKGRSVGASKHHQPLDVVV